MCDGVQLAVVAGHDERALLCMVLAGTYLLGSHGHLDRSMKSFVWMSVLILENIESWGTGSIWPGAGRCSMFGPVMHARFEGASFSSQRDLLHDVIVLPSKKTSIELLLSSARDSQATSESQTFVS